VSELEKEMYEKKFKMRKMEKVRLFEARATKMALLMLMVAIIGTAFIVS
jgi:hypothetical protein